MLHGSISGGPKIFFLGSVWWVRVSCWLGKLAFLRMRFIFTGNEHLMYDVDRCRREPCQSCSYHLVNTFYLPELKPNLLSLAASVELCCVPCKLCFKTLDEKSCCSLVLEKWYSSIDDSYSLGNLFVKLLK